MSFVALSFLSDFALNIHFPCSLISPHTPTPSDLPSSRKRRSHVRGNMPCRTGDVIPSTEAISRQRLCPRCTPHQGPVPWRCTTLGVFVSVTAVSRRVRTGPRLQLEGHTSCSTHYGVMRRWHGGGSRGASPALECQGGKAPIFMCCDIHVLSTDARPRKAADSNRQYVSLDSSALAREPAPPVF